MSDSDDDWGDEKQVEVPAYIMVGRVKEDYYPETHKHLTLFAGELVYVFKKSSDEGPGWWEGETRGEYGSFMAKYIEEVVKPEGK